ncbi:hypothetical protein [Anaerocolumna jejuensis]|uniref:hypothetical protein n=1 Tax=Anaerocolumna jejuensis TaxID=259063 RepID=UPI000933E32A|nr:hypothetical protein [Anaerocolumna jejuensis]
MIQNAEWKFKKTDNDKWQSLIAGLLPFFILTAMSSQTRGKIGPRILQALIYYYDIVLML